jgi:acid phosphatase type 7
MGLRSISLGLALAACAALLAVPAPGGGQPARVVKGPYVTNFSDVDAVIRYEADVPGPTTLAIGIEKSVLPLRKIADQGAGTMHAVHVTGLEADKAYSYAVLSGTQIIATGHFTTAGKPDGGTPARFVVFGDSRSDPATHAAIVAGIRNTPADFLVNTGDIVAEGSSMDDWQTFFQVEAPLLREVPLLLCIGNHELHDDAAGANFARYFSFSDATGAPRLYGTTRVDAVRFFFLNGQQEFESGDERAWLERSLAQADNEPGLSFRIAVVHHGPWSAGPHGPNPRLVAAHVPELLAAHHVDLVLSGHDHIYERGDAGGTKYVISGGAGAPLYELASPLPPTTRKAESTYNYVEMTATRFEMTLEAHRLDGSLIEKCGFAKGGGWDCDSKVTPHATVGPPPGAVPSTSSAGGSAAPPSPPPRSSSCTIGPSGSPGLSGAAALAAVVAAAGARAARRRRRR